jgi:flagellin
MNELTFENKVSGRKAHELRAAALQEARDQKESFPMALSILNNVAALTAENQISKTQTSLQKTLLQLSSGSKINSGADDAAGLSVANGLDANITALNQSASNASDGVGALQVADGALSEVTSLLNRAVTLATEASTSGLSTAQMTAIDTEYQSILSEVDSIGKTTTFNGTAVFGNTQNVYLSDGTSSGSYTISTDVASLSSTDLTLNSTALTTTTSAQSALTAITNAISTVAANRGSLGASINQLNAASSVDTVQVQNLTTASNTVSAADISSAVADMSKYNILNQTGISALSQANQMQQGVLKLLQ